ncbi:MAG: SMR family transporter [Pseudomonadota bacterium]
MPAPAIAYLFLIASVLAEAVGFAALNAADPFRRFWPAIGMAGGFGLSMYFLTLTLQHMPLGVVYALSSGLGIVVTATVGLAVFGQRLDLAAIAGLALILAGVVIINAFSEFAVH